VGAVEWIARMKLDPGTSLDGIRSAAVLGGGNTALDVVQELASLGVPEVCLVYRRSEEEMPGYEHEWLGARKLGVRLLERAAVTRVVRDSNGALSGIELVRTEGGRPTSERLTSVECQLVVVATGQERLIELAAQFPGVACDELGCVIADEETLVTGNPRVFTGGDCRNGGKEVVNAVDEGQRAARAIDSLLRGES
jgi:dihydropyrimidine dehydrogenase (NAD+) subunit PreT